MARGKTIKDFMRKPMHDALDEWVDAVQELNTWRGKSVHEAAKAARYAKDMHTIYAALLEQELCK